MRARHIRVSVSFEVPSYPSLHAELNIQACITRGDEGTSCKGLLGGVWTLCKTERRFFAQQQQRSHASGSYDSDLCAFNLPAQVKYIYIQKQRFQKFCDELDLHDAFNNDQDRHIYIGLYSNDFAQISLDAHFETTLNPFYLFHSALHSWVELKACR